MFRLLEFLLIRASLSAVQAIPTPVCLQLCRTIARAAYGLDRRHRKRTRDHLRLAYPDAPAEAMGRRVFESLGRHAAEFIHVLRRNPPPLRLENAEILLEAYRRGKGVVAVSAHLGSFSLLGLVPRLLGVEATVIMKRQKNARLLGWIRGLIQRRFGVGVILKPDVPKEGPALLGRGRVLLFFADQHPIAGGLPATFFGLPVEAASGPAVFAKRYGAPLVVATIRGSGVVRFDGPVSTEGSLAEISQRWLDLLEARIREHPEQWMWMHRRWRKAATSSPPSSP